MVLVGLVALLAAAAGSVPMAGDRPARHRWRAARLLVAASVVQVTTMVLAPDSTAARTAALVLTGLLVGLFLYGNRRAPGVPLVAAGLLLNGLVIAVNGAMPVSLQAAGEAGLTRPDLRLEADPLREPETAGTRLAFLGDVVAVPLPGLPQVVSPGDVLVASGVGLLLLLRGAQTPSGRMRPTVLVRDSTTTGSYS